MDFISILKARRDAANQCINSSVVSEEDKEPLRKGEQFLQYSYYFTKGVIAAGFIFLVDWKKQVPIMKRQVPFAILAFGMCAIADYSASEYIFKQNQQTLLKYTGFRDGIYVNPAKYMKMKDSFRSQGERVYIDSEKDLLDDEQ